MEFWIFAGRLLIAVLMGVAGIGKLANLTRSSQTMRAFGVSAPFASTVGAAVPIAELCAAFLLLTPLAWWGALLSLILLLSFTAGILYNLMQGKRPDCHCFGQLYSKPIGWPTLARNGGLVILAAWLLAQEDSRLSSNESAQWISLIALITAAIAGYWLLKQQQQNQQLRQRLESLEAQIGATSTTPATNANHNGLYIGSSAPSFQLADMNGQTNTLADLLAAQKPLYLLFLDPTCGSCNELAPEIEQWQQQYADKLTIVPISRGDAKSTRHSKAGLQNLLLQEKAEVSTAYHIERMPSAVLIHPAGTIASAIASGADAIRTQISHLAQQPVETVSSNEQLKNEVSGEYNYCPNGVDNSTALHPIAQRGEVAPDFILPELEGEMLGLDPLRGYQLMLIFWNPTCTHCQQMLDEIKAIEDDRSTDAPQIIFIATGTAEANRAQEFRSPVLLDTDMAVTRRYGAIGTPSALRIDTNGRIASHMAAGRKEVLALLAEGSGAIS